MFAGVIYVVFEFKKWYNIIIEIKKERLGSNDG